MKSEIRDKNLLISFGDKISSGEYIIHSRFKNSINFYYKERLITLGNKKIGSGPSNIIFEKNYFVGFQVFDKNEKLIGTITTVDESTENTLFVLNDGGKEILIPVSEEYILIIYLQKLQ